MSKEMLINVSEGEECRIALLENGKLDEFYIERTSSTSHVGNIYKGRVVNVEPSIQAAFIDFGLGRNGFLHISDLQPSYFGHKGEEFSESVGRKMARRDRPPIQRCLRRGDDIIVQIIKEGIGTKGPTLSTYLSIPGRILVMMPGMSNLGVSRKIEDEAERKRLRQILDSLEPPDGAGFIIRTAGVGKSKAEIQRDLAYLTRLMQQVNKRMQQSGPVELYTEGDLVTRTVRDVFTTEIDRIIVDNKEVAERVADFVKLSSPRTKEKVEFYDGPLPLFHKYNIEKEIEMMYSRHVPLPSGGSLVIDQTEAVVAIDVNSGKFRDHSDAEMTAFKTDMEAAEEIPRQLKLRDLGGVIICDFIDLRFDRHRHELDRRLQDNFRSDRAKTKVLRMSQFGIIEITRQRMRPSVKRSIYCDCPHCRGSGLVKTTESMSLDVMRKLAIATHDQRVARVELTVHTDVAFFLNNRKRRQLAELERSTGRRILVRTADNLGLDEVRFDLYDGRDGIVAIPELLSQTPQTSQEAQTMAKQARQQVRRGGDRVERRPEVDRRERRTVEHDEKLEMDELEEAVERREMAASAGEIPSEPAQAPQSRPPFAPRQDQTAPIAGGGEGEEEYQGDEEGVETPEVIPAPIQPAPATPVVQRPYYQQQPQQPGSGRGRLRRRGRGRGRFGAEGQEEAEQFVSEEALPPVDEKAPVADTRVMPAAPPAPVIRPTPQVDYKPAPIAEWPEERPVRRAPRPMQPAVPAELLPPAVEAEPEPTKGGKKGRGKKVVAKPAPKKKPTRKGKKGSDEVDISTGPSAEAAQVTVDVVEPEPPVRIADPEPIVRRVPGDRHLATDEPVDPDTVRVVRTVRDLDHVPDTDERR